VPAVRGRAAGSVRTLVSARGAARRGRRRPARRLALAVLALALAGCADEDPRVVAVPMHPGAQKGTADVRAARRAYDGAPAVIPHRAFGAACTSCHTAAGMAVADVGFAPPAPHLATRGLQAEARCELCHVYRRSDGVWRASRFEGLAQDLRQGRRLTATAPPVMPHAAFMRENCLACHGGPAAREEIRTSHPERVRCRQCHVERQTGASFASAALPRSGK
jgi:hypothetical protein